MRMREMTRKRKKHQNETVFFVAGKIQSLVSIGANVINTTEIGKNHADNFNHEINISSRKNKNRNERINKITEKIVRGIPSI